MIIVQLKGGLGNQMFQYALGRVLALKNNDVLKLDITAYSNTAYNRPDTIRHFDLEHFNIKVSIASPCDIQRLRNPYGILSRAFRFFKNKILKIYFQDYDPKLLEMKGDIYLEGYFQSELYFKNIRETILSDFSLKNISSHAQKMINSIKNAKTKGPVISLHIRRGDLVIDAKTNLYHGVCTLSYYESAIEKMKDFLHSHEITSIPTYYIFSDDIDWVKENLKITYPTIFVSGTGMSDPEEIIVMSLCDHHIIANSTFSWWSAWLNKNPDKIVIAPKPWIRKVPNPHKNILPKEWIQI